MAATPSTMIPLGTSAPRFTLPDPAREGVVSIDDFDSDVLVVMFLCNHCPFVKHVKPELLRLASDYAGKSVDFIAINANDVERYPEDGPAKMVEEGYPFPYLFDETQAVAKAYQAACTPDFFVFDRDRRLFYRGQLDESRPKNDEPLDGRDLRRAIDLALRGEDPPREQRPSIGCNIKWKPGNEPSYESTLG